MSPNVAQAIVAGIVFIWGVYQTFSNWRISRNQEALRRDFDLLKLQLDQSVQRLQRARELVNRAHQAELLMFHFREQGDQENWATKYVELSACWAELRGIALAINDADFLKLVNHVDDYNRPENMMQREGILRTYTQSLHVQINRLLEQTTKSATIVSKPSDK